MTFTGKATYSAGATLPEIAEDVSDIVALVSPHETPLLDLISDPERVARSTVHEWLEDELLPNTDTINDGGIGSPSSDPQFDVAHGDRFRVGDQVRPAGSSEIMLVTEVAGDTLTVVRGYGGTSTAAVNDEQVLHILGNAALEGDAAPGARFTTRSRRQNYTQIFTAGVEVSGSQLAAQSLGVEDEMDYQKQERLRELLRDLENCVINGVAAESDPQGGADTRRTMRGLLASMTTNRFQPGSGDMPEGDGQNSDVLNEHVLNAAMRFIWEQSAGTLDTIVCGGLQKRRINQFVSASQRFHTHEHAFSRMIDVYESDFGVCRVVLSRWVPPDTLLLLDSSRLDVLPLAGRSFHFKPLASSGDSELGQVIGEYTLELRNENAHGVITGLHTTEPAD